MKHYGDITKINGATVPPVDIICGGSPCQDLSIAGKRAGLAGARSGLFMDQIRIIKEMRTNGDELHCGRTNNTIRNCRFMVWENVPGAFSSNNGEDFRAVLEETARICDESAVIPGPPGGRWTNAGCIVGAGWSIAWRLHDAQFWGVPQRRKRIALIADFRGHAAAEVLFERKGLSRDFEPCGTQGKETAGSAVGSATQTSKCLNGWDVQSKHIQPQEGKAESLYAGERRYGGGESYVLQEKNICAGFKHKQGAKAGGIGFKEEVSPTLSFGQMPAVLENKEKAISFQERGPNAVCARDAKGVASTVRRLTPKECERLQGFPDDWTNIGEWIDSKGKKHKDADSPRYKASIALPFWKWLAKRIVAVLKEDGIEDPKMASLFDGIGGFPLSFSEAGCVPVWASEIEEFPIAVTKKHFPE